MLVTRIDEYKKDRFKIFINEEFAFVLYKGELKLYKIESGKKISDTDYDTIIHTLLPKRAKLRAMNLLKSHMYTERMLRLKLSEGLYPKECIDEAIEYVKAYRYVDDTEYARQYISSRYKNKSRLELKRYLDSKGVDSFVFDQVFAEFCEEFSQEEVLKGFIDKKLIKGKIDITDDKARVKIINSCLRKGYSLSLINKVLSNHTC